MGINSGALLIFLPLVLFDYVKLQTLFPHQLHLFICFEFRPSCFYNAGTNWDPSQNLPFCRKHGMHQGISEVGSYLRASRKPQKNGGDYKCLCMNQSLQMDWLSLIVLFIKLRSPSKITIIFFEPFRNSFYF